MNVEKGYTYEDGLIVSQTVDYITFNDSLITDLSYTDFSGAELVMSDNCVAYGVYLPKSDSMLLTISDSYRLVEVVNQDESDPFLLNWIETSAGLSIFADSLSDQFMFATKKNGYNYLEDYTGNAAFSEAEMRRILLALREKQGSYAQRGAQYLLVVLPNTQSVYDEYMPDYLGAISKSTRLAVLEEFLLQNRFAHILDPTEELDGYRREGLLYNNTENTLNSRGMYFIYRTICDHISPTVMQNTNVLTFEQLSFYQHTTHGRQIAQKAALADVARNHTVSLSNTMPLNYRLVYDAGQVSTTRLHSFGQSFDVESSPSLLLQFGNDWECSQAEPFFSSTFGRVTYQIGYEDSADIYEQADPDIVIRFVREDELLRLLP
jgi:hypothetical protein